LKAERHENAQRREGEAAGIKSASVEQRDDEDCDYVVNDSECQQKNPNGAGDRFAEQFEHADGERDVSGGRYRPTMAAPRNGVETLTNQRRNDNTAKGCQHRQNGFGRT